MISKIRVRHEHRSHKRFTMYLREVRNHRILPFVLNSTSFNPPSLLGRSAPRLDQGKHSPRISHMTVTRWIPSAVHTALQGGRSKLGVMPGLPVRSPAPVHLSPVKPASFCQQHNNPQHKVEHQRGYGLVV